MMQRQPSLILECCTTTRQLKLGRFGLLPHDLKAELCQSYKTEIQHLEADHACFDSHGRVSKQGVVVSAIRVARVKVSILFNESKVSTG